MCRNIKTLHNFKPPATEAEIRASALQFVRKLSGFSQGPSPRNAPVRPGAFRRIAYPRDNRVLEPRASPAGACYDASGMAEGAGSP